MLLITGVDLMSSEEEIAKRVRGRKWVRHVHLCRPRGGKRNTAFMAFVDFHTAEGATYAIKNAH